MRKFNRAFTLIELTVILLIIALSLTIVIPKISSSTNPRFMLRSSTNKITSIIEYAHQQAACKRFTYFVNINCREGTYWISSQGKDGQIIQIKDQLDLNGRLPDGVTFVAVKLLGENVNFQDVIAIRLSPDGCADPAEIVLSCSTGETMSIVIDEFSGQIETCTLEEMS